MSTTTPTATFITTVEVKGLPVTVVKRENGVIHMVVNSYSYQHRLIRALSDFQKIAFMRGLLLTGGVVLKRIVEDTIEVEGGQLDYLITEGGSDSQTVFIYTPN